MTTLLEWHPFPINDHLIQDMRSSLARTIAITGLFAVNVLACRGEPTGPTPVVTPPVPYVPPPRVLATMKFAPDSIALMRGDSGSVSLVGTYIVGGPDGIAQSPVGVDEATLTVKDSMVARIDTVRRMITAVGSGKTVITATDKRGGTTQMTVTVRAPYYVRVIPGASCGRIGYDHQYSAELYDTNLIRLPDEPVTWTSSDTSVATINANGLLHTRKAGTANIVATIHGEPATSALTVDPAPLGTPMTCGGIFPPPLTSEATSKSSSWQTR